MFEYNGYKFEPLRKLKKEESKDIKTFSRHIASDRELGMCDYDVDWKKSEYSWKEFYDASGDSQMDIFRCLEMVSCMFRVSMSCLHLHKLASQN